MQTSKVLTPKIDADHQWNPSMGGGGRVATKKRDAPLLRCDSRVFVSKTLISCLYRSIFFMPKQKFEFLQPLPRPLPTHFPLLCGLKSMQEKKSTSNLLFN